MTACPKCGHDPAAAVLASFEFHVDRDAPSLNDHVFNVGASRHRYRKERDAWCWELRAIRLLRQIPRALAGGKRRVTITRCYHGRQRERDADNLAGGMKPIVDALVLEGFLADDSPGAAELHYAQRKATPTGLTIHIEVLR